MKALFGMFVGLLFVLTCDAATINVPADYSTIQAAIDAAVPGDVVVISPGTYTGAGNQDLDFKGKAITVRSGNPSDPCVVDSTIIDCQNSGRGFNFHSGESSNSVLAGLTIKNGYADGGGILCSTSSPLITNCVIKSNQTPASPSIDGANGWPGHDGAGICCINSLAIIRNCIIMDNRTGNGGNSNPYFYSCPPSPEPCVDPSYNGGDGGNGGGIYVDPISVIIIENCLIISNSTGNGGSSEYPHASGTHGGNGGNGAGVYLAGAATVKNCTIYGNHTGNGGTGLVNGSKGSGGGTSSVNAAIQNTIIWGNDDPDVSGSPTISYSDVDGGYTGIHNISANPLFVAGRFGNCYLSQISSGQASDSPCIDSGNYLAHDLGYDALTTRTDYVGDINLVDIGYHYPLIGRVDINHDYGINFVDFGFFATDWFNYQIRSDFMPDGQIDYQDLSMFADNWLECYVAQASCPTPANNSSTSSNRLIWTAGGGAISHDIYLSTNINDVNIADHTSDTFKGNFSCPVFDPCALPPSIYYWRVDEVGPVCTKKGTIWMFEKLPLTDPNFVSWWKFDDASGLTALDSMGTNNGSIINGTWTTGKIDGALSFNGSGGYVNCGNDASLDITDKISISAWVKFNALTDNQIIIAKQGTLFSSENYILKRSSSATNYQLSFSYRGSTRHIYNTTGANLTAGTWYHIVVTYTFGTGSSIKIYLDSNLLGGFWDMGNGNAPVTTNTQVVTIGGLTNGYYANAIIDDVRLYKRILSQAEIQQLYQSGP